MEPHASGSPGHLPKEGDGVENAILQMDVNALKHLSNVMHKRQKVIDRAQNDARHKETEQTALEATGLLKTGLLERLKELDPTKRQKAKEDSDELMASVIAGMQGDRTKCGLCPEAPEITARV